jgi:uncharacterized protein YcgI (DUF1989 family)
MGAVEVLVPAGHGRAFPVPKGSLLEVIDVEGQQVADFISIIEDDPREWLSATHTRSTTLRLNMQVGDRLQTNWRRDMYEVVRDDVGTHDLITSMCDQRRYRIDYGVEGHRSCRSNFVEALAPWGYEEWEIPDVINISQLRQRGAAQQARRQIRAARPGRWHSGRDLGLPSGSQPVQRISPKSDPGEDCRGLSFQEGGDRWIFS